ncbi:MAG: hypothetical protein WD907_00230, partial [Bacilli bacterium]
QQYEVKKHLEQEISNIEHVTFKSLDITNEEINIDVSLSNIKELRNSYQQIYGIAEKYNGRDKPINIHINDTRSEKLTTIWERANFVVSESIATHAYSAIPRYFDGIYAEHLLTKSNVMMDEKFVYIHLTDGKSELYHIVPRYLVQEVNKDE